MNIMILFIEYLSILYLFSGLLNIEFN